MNGQPTGFFPMIFPFQQAPAPKDEPPARVRQAVEFLVLLTHKMMPRAAVNDLSIEWYEGQKLIGPEVEAQIAACDLLTRYFKGQFKADALEKKEPQDWGSAINCPICLGRINEDCEVCQGKGRVLIKPMGGK